MAVSACLEIHEINVGQGDSVLIINRDLVKLTAAIVSNKGAKAVPADPIDHVPYCLANSVPLAGTVTKALLVDGGDDEYGGDVINYLTDLGVLDGAKVWRPDLSVLEVLLQLVTLLAKKGRLTGDEPFNVFNQTMSASVREGAGGPVTCVALGSPVGQNCQTMGGKFGDVVVNVPDADISASYQPGPVTGWATIGQAGYSVLSATLRLATVLFQKGVLTGSEPFDLFNNATAIRIR